MLLSALGAFFLLAAAVVGLVVLVALDGSLHTDSTETCVSAPDGSTQSTNTDCETTDEAGGLLVVSVFGGASLVAGSLLLIGAGVAPAKQGGRPAYASAGPGGPPSGPGWSAPGQ